MEIARVGRTSQGGWGETTGAADMVSGRLSEIANSLPSGYTVTLP
jgi:hypothetical protein